MKIRLVSYCPSEEAISAGRESLTPELMCAVGARYSRNNEGLDAILEKVDKNNPSKSIDSIFKFLDYGHQSLQNMASFAIFLDGISLFSAYYMWSISPLANGQESSSRYIELNEEGLVDPHILGIPEDEIPSWELLMKDSFKDYKLALEFWKDISEKYPELVRLPKLKDDSLKSKNIENRIKRNFIYDRARYFLPVASKTNLMLTMSARAWTDLTQMLLSHPVLELNKIGELILEELKLVVPRLVKYARETESTKKQLNLEFKKTISFVSPETKYSKPELEILASPSLNLSSVVSDNLLFRDNRYSLIGSDLKRTFVRFSWSKMALAEIRDLNRHGTGVKYCPLKPLGFYCAEDVIPEGNVKFIDISNSFKCMVKSLQLLEDEKPYYIYYTQLGFEYYFEHTTSADKYIYEMELRTGIGSHFKYLQHCKDSLKLWYNKFPETKDFILEGVGEPE